MRFLKIACLALLAGFAEAATPKLGGFLANESGVSAATTYGFSLNSYGVDQISFVVLWSSANPGTSSFTDGQTSSATLRVSSSPAQGIPGEAVCINQTCLFDGKDWAHDTSGQSSGTALSIATAINANATLNKVVISTVSAGQTTIYTTSTVVGLVSNYLLYSSSPTALVWTPANAMVGGKDASYTLNGTVILSSNPWSPVGQNPMVALPVVYSQGVSPILGLTDQTTYYVIPETSGAFSLATTSTGAVAGYGLLPNTSSTTIPGAFIALRSTQTKTTADNYTLRTTNFAGSPTGIWQVSNDGTNWATYPSSGTVTLTPSGASSTAADFGTINFGFLRFNLNTPPTGGALNLRIEPNAKNSGL